MTVSFPVAQAKSSPVPEVKLRAWSSRDVARLSGASLRQLQWWDEAKLTNVKRGGVRRIREYHGEDVFEIIVIAHLRKSGMSLQRVRRAMRRFRMLRMEHGYTGYLLVSDVGRVVLVATGDWEGDKDAVLGRLQESRCAYHVIGMTDTVLRVNGMYVTGAEVMKGGALALEDVQKRA